MPRKSTFYAVITSLTHSTVEVSGIARITKRILKVMLDGCAPAGGELTRL